MTVTLNIAPDLENEVRNAADQEGMPTDKYIVTVLKHHLYSAARNPPASLRNGSSTVPAD